MIPAHCMITSLPYSNLLQGVRSIVSHSKAFLCTACCCNHRGAGHEVEIKVIAKKKIYIYIYTHAYVYYTYKQMCRYCNRYTLLHHNILLLNVLINKALTLGQRVIILNRGSRPRKRTGRK